MKRLWKLSEQHPFGTRDLIDLLQKHGAEFVAKPALSVPAGAFKAALENASKLCLSADDIEFIRKELKDAGIDDDEEAQVDLYDLC